MNNQKGSAIIVVLILPISLAVALFAATFLGWYAFQLKLQARDRGFQDVANLQTTLKMMMATRESCRQSLNGQGLGATTDDLQNGNKALQIFIPKAGGNLGDGNEVFLTAQGNFQSLKINSINYDEASLVASNLEKSYIVNVLIKYVNPHYGTEKTLNIPLYFTADNAGNLMDCLGTTYAAPGVTVEELLCQQTLGGDYTYLPSAKTCVVKSSTPVAQN